MRGEVPRQRFESVSGSIEEAGPLSASLSGAKNPGVAQSSPWLFQYYLSNEFDLVGGDWNIWIIFPYIGNNPN